MSFIELQLWLTQVLITALVRLNIRQDLYLIQIPPAIVHTEQFRESVIEFLGTNQRFSTPNSYLIGLFVRFLE
jgi:hypothetical protein